MLAKRQVDFDIIKHNSARKKSKESVEGRKDSVVFQPIKSLEIKFDSNSYKKKPKLKAPFRNGEKPEELQPLKLKKLSLMSSSLSHAQITDKAKRQLASYRRQENFPYY